MEILTCHNATKSYPVGNQSVEVLHPITLSIQAKEYIGITGPSGSGKTTLLYVLSGLEKASSGDVFLNGVNLSSLSNDARIHLRQNDIGFIFQSYNLIHNLTVFENLELARIIANRSNQKQSLRVLTMVGLENFRHYYPHQLSGGMQQRVAIARAILNQPKILFADEPTGNLDSQNGKEIMNLLKKIHEEENLTIILVTHNPDNLTDCTRLISLRDGQIISS